MPEHIKVNFHISWIEQVGFNINNQFQTQADAGLDAIITDSVQLASNTLSEGRSTS